MESYRNEWGNKSDWKKVSVRKTEAYSETSETSKIEFFFAKIDHSLRVFFAKNLSQLSAVNSFFKRLFFRCLTGFYLNAPLKGETV